MEITGKIVQLLPLQTGQGKNGVWKKQDYIIEFGDQYPKKVCFNIWGDKIDTFDLKEGEEVKVDFDIESREFNGRWYTDVKAWNVSRPNGSVAPVNSAPLPKEEDFLSQAPGTDLPF
ncbi:MAG: DUF3127 domain-containing protein [Bacteroidales bacterium]|nr:DUF3127 domain-containing protein [Bacteroidales bacterium]